MWPTYLSVVVRCLQEYPLATIGLVVVSCPAPKVPTGQVTSAQPTPQHGPAVRVAVASPQVATCARQAAAAHALMQLLAIVSRFLFQGLRPKMSHTATQFQGQGGCCKFCCSYACTHATLPAVSFCSKQCLTPFMFLSLALCVQTFTITHPSQLMPLPCF